MINVNLLPKTLRRSRSFNPWQGVAVAVPLVTLLTCGFLQLQVSNEKARLTEQGAELRNEKAVLQPFVDEQATLEAEQGELAGITGVAQTVRTGRIFWSRQLYAMLETRPTPGPQLASRMAFTALELRTLDPSASTQLGGAEMYEGLQAVAEMSVSGVAGSTEVVANYLRELQAAPNFAVSFSDLSQDPETKFYNFNLTIGAASLEGTKPEPAAQLGTPLGTPSETQTAANGGGN